MSKTQKIGATYARWTRLKEKYGVSEGWSDFDSYVAWEKDESAKMNDASFAVEVVDSSKPAGPLNVEMIPMWKKKQETSFRNYVAVIWRKLLDKESDVCDDWKDFENFLAWYRDERGYGNKVTRKALGAAGPETMEKSGEVNKYMAQVYNSIARKKKMSPEWNGLAGRQIFYYWARTTRPEPLYEPIFCTEYAGPNTYIDLSGVYTDIYRPSWMNQEAWNDARREFLASAEYANKNHKPLPECDRTFKGWVDSRRSVYCRDVGGRYAWI